ncbi:hypothetical protein [uncultured Enterococcus sp.]|uniref:hypothetical protein n=1 Tax=uncultured Enterococcus sp. TaxID=167972 RepID=UPI002AA9199D|nr:hypothetical protein [uncultured Enterococcus sp.]
MGNNVKQETIYVVTTEFYDNGERTFLPHKTQKGAYKTFIKLIKETYTLDDLLDPDIHCELDSSGGLLKVSKHGMQYNEISIEKRILGN